MKQSKVFPSFLALGLIFTVMAEESPFGICSHMSRPGVDYEVRELNMPMMNEAGIAVFRTDYDWNSVEPKQGQWNFNIYDNLLKSSRKYKIDILPIINSGTSFAKPRIKDKDLWLNYIHKLVSRYENDLKYWEIINEQNSWISPKEYTELLKGAYTTIKAINPDLKVLYGGTVDIPFEYLETTLQNGAGDFFDIMNIHPYRIGSIPEYTLKRDILALKEKMNEYGIGEKPIWVTEYGHATAENHPYMGKVLPVILRYLNLPCKDMKIAVLSDDQKVLLSADTPDFNFREFIPGIAEVNRVTFRELMKLNPEEWPLLLPTNGESFPMEYQPALVNYVRKGGTILLTSGGPLYYDWRQMWDGSVRNVQDLTGKARELRFGWKMAAMPGEGTIAAAPGFEEIDYVRNYKSSHFRYLSASNLKQGDQLIPVMNIKFQDGSTYPVVGIFKLNSDFKGNVILLENLPVYQNCTEEQQSKLLPRSYLIMLSAGVEKIFWYNFRSGEQDPYNRECHFGIVRKNHGKKPSFMAYKTLTQHYPAGSSTPVLTEKSPFYYASWTKPDQDCVYALWQLRDHCDMKIDIKGKVKSIKNHIGKDVTMQNGSLKISDSITYITGQKGLKIDICR